MGDDGRRWNETNVTNANELDEGVGRTTRLAFGHKKIVSYAPFHRHNPTSPTLLVHYCELLAAAACALASSRTLNASMTSTFHIASLAGSSLRSRRRSASRARVARDHPEPVAGTRVPAHAT